MSCTWPANALMHQLAPVSAEHAREGQKLMLHAVLGRFAGCQHVARANGVCTHCVSVAVADGLHMIFECPALQAFRQQYAPFFFTNTNTMRFFFSKQDHMQVSKFVLDCSDVFHI